MIKLRVPTKELEKWKERSGGNLSGWIRERCNGGCGKDMGGTDTVPVVERGIGAGERSELADARKSVRGVEKAKGKSCVHGIAKGWNCWQCGGLAKVAG
jgi:hypothetical protein